MIKNLTCNLNNTLLEVMNIINENSMGVCFVTDDNNSLKGVVTDGDIRRAILNHKSLDSLIVDILNKNFVCGHVDDSNDALIEKINEKINENIDINIIPIVDQNNQLVDYFRYSHQSHFPVAIPNLGGNEFKYLTDAFLSTWISSSGDYIDKFEDKFSNYSDCEYGISVANGTPARLNLIIFFKGRLIIKKVMIGNKRSKNALGISLFFHNHIRRFIIAVIIPTLYLQTQNPIGLLNLIF